MSTSFIGSRLAWVLLLLVLGIQLAFAERTTTYFHTDGLGSVVAASDQSGAVLWRKSYAPFGEQIDGQPDNERLSYTGKPHDDVIGLTYFGGRYYDPSIGRFASVDPVGFVESNPMSFNRYAYVNNNPYKYVDPDGEFLNFAAKFVLDVGVNIAFNYVTTGEMDVGGALKESAVGILNPAKTVAKAGKLAAVMLKTEKAAEAAGKTQKKVERLRHFTNSKGSAGIEADQVIKASDQNRVFTVRAKGNPPSARDVEEQLGISRGKGSHYVDFDASPGEFSVVQNPKTGATERVFKGDVSLGGRNPTFHRNR